MKYKKEILILIMAAVIFCGFFAYRLWSDKYPDDIFAGNKNFNLTEEEKTLIKERYEEARKKLDEASTDDEKFSAHMQIGFQFHILYDYKNAKTSFLKAAKIKPDNHAAYVALYQVEADAGDIESARDYIKKAISLKEDNPGLWIKYIQLEIERFSIGKEEADKLYLEALEKTGSHADVIVAYAGFLEKNGDAAAALEYWKKAYAQYPIELYGAEIKRLEKIVK